MNQRHLLFPLAALLLAPSLTTAGEPATYSDAEQVQNTDGLPTRKPNIFKRAWVSVCTDFKRNNNWPDPFVAADRVTVRAPFDICTANGWRIQNTLSEHHFVEDSAELSETGRLKVAAIINETPVAYRAIFVLRNNDPSITAGRVASIQEAVAKTLGDRPPVPIFETYDKPRGTPAFYVDEVTRRYQATMPDPRLPEEDNASATIGAGQ